MRWALACAGALWVSTARAQSVDVGDLPPLPPAADDARSSATLHAAAEADEDVVVGAAKREQSLGNVASAVVSMPSCMHRRCGASM